MRGGCLPENPVFMSASPFTDGLEKIERCFSWGVKGVFTKTIWIGGHMPAKEERIVVQDGRVYNTATYSPYNSDIWLEWVDSLIRQGRCVVPNILGRDPEEMMHYVKRLEKIGVPMIELGISCPNDGEVLSDEEAAGFIQRVCEESAVEITVKLTADTVLLPRIEKFKEAGICGVTVSDALPGYCVKDGIGFCAGYSGAGIKPLVLRKIVEIRGRFSKILIFGAGGIQTREDVGEYLNAGADYVQLCSVGYIRGIAGIRHILEEGGEPL